jgi:Na+-transporting NADH:ubiquinone oxidoreductase subunit NqrA
MTKNLPVTAEPSDYDRMAASIFAFIADDIPIQALEDLTVIAENAKEFEAGMNAMVELGDILLDHYDFSRMLTMKEPDDGPYDEEGNPDDDGDYDIT